MKLGFALPNIGLIGSPDAVTSVATRAEALGYDSLWTIERLLYPLQPQSPYPGTPDGTLPAPYQHCLDPLETLTFAAAQTTRVGLGTSVLDMLYYNPVMLARRLTTLDVLSHGRLRVGLGLGWSKDEFEAAGASWNERGARADEFIAVLQAIWTHDPVEFQGQFFRIPKSIIQPKPVQQPYPPLYFAAFAPPALRRLARWADGWNPAGIPIDGMRQQFEGLKHMAEAAGRDPATLQMVVRANLELAEHPLGPDRMIFAGTLDQIQSDIEGCRQIGADEIILDPTFSAGVQRLDRWLEIMERLRHLA
jgi:probable F420-dependent oxidoreductase